MRHVYTILLLVLSIPAQALTIPQGTLYFDNNKTLYNAVCFVYGSDQRQETYVTPMTLDGNKWRVDIPQTVPDMYRFTHGPTTMTAFCHFGSLTSNGA